jgi:hypothetical protein
VDKTPEGDIYVINDPGGMHNKGSIQMNGAGGANAPYTENAGYDEANNYCTDSCHTTGEKFNGNIKANTVDLREFGSGSCTSCHTSGGSGEVVTESSSHTTATGYTCEECHGSHTGGDMEIPNNTTVGINYSEDGATGIPLKDPVGSASTEAEICWNCHGASHSEWGTNTGGTYDYGTYTGSWFSGGTWNSGAGFTYKDGALNSPPGTQTRWSSHDTGSTVGNTQEAVGWVRCSYCHDVHDTMGPTGKPYLRGTWISNPFPEDGAPRTAADGGLETTYASNKRAESNNTVIPRAGTLESGVAENGLGGWQIEQNNDGAWAHTTEYSAYGGLCALCHSASALETAWAGHGVASGSSFSGASKLTYDPSDRGEWTDSSWAWKQAMMGHMRIPEAQTRGTYVGQTTTYIHGLRNGNNISSNPSYPQNGIGTVWANDPQTNDASITTPTFVDGAVTTIIAGPGRSAATDFHNFPCSKCHNPHASRLPRLMITNCLDVALNTVDDGLNPSEWPPPTGTATDATYGSTQLGYSPTAVNCHRYVDSSDGNAEVGAEPGWNSVTPW